ncbi:HMG1 [Symbiodinium sp. KB8]|nr:HMG1 [Symbiodinium sp. KB8]
MAKQKRLEVRAQHVDSDCRFHPAITETSRQLVSNNLDLLGETPEERIHRLAVRDAERREQTRAELEQLHHKDCTFKPQINPVSEIIATSRAEASTSSGRVEDSGAHERLYRSAKIPAGSGDEWPSEYSFRPQLDPRSSKRFSHIKSRYAKRSELVETIRQEQEKKAEYLLERRRQLEEEKNADCTFAPRVKEIFQDNQKPIAVSGLDRFFELKSLALKKQQAKRGTIAVTTPKELEAKESHVAFFRISAFFSMADEKNFLQKVSWDGDPQGWPDFVRRAWNITQDLDHAALVRRHVNGYMVEQRSDTAAPDASAPESLEEDKTFPEDLDEDLDPGVRGDRGCSNSDDSTKALEELRLWESYEEAVEAAAGNSLRFEDIERCLRNMEEELSTHDMDTGADAILENQEVLYLGTQLPHAAQAAAESSNSWGEPENGFWSTEDDGSCIWSQDFGDGDYFHEDASGVFWSWNHSHKDDLG